MQRCCEGVSRRRHLVLSLVPIVAVTLAADSGFAGAWSQSRHAAYTKLTYANTTTIGRYDAEGGALPSDYGGNFVFLYGEYGLLDDFTVIASGPLLQIVSDVERDYVLDARNKARVTAFLGGDYNLAAKYQFLGAPPVAVQVGLKVPIGYDNAELLVPLGTGKVDVDAKLLAGVSLYPIPGYVTGEAGYRLRGKGFADEVPFAVEAGYFVLDTVYVQLFADGVYGLGDLDSAAGGGRFLSTEHRFRAGGGLIYPLPFSNEVAVNVTYLKTLVGRNTINAHEVFVGCAYEFSLAEEKP